jgi:hypothetical protein
VTWKSFFEGFAAGITILFGAIDKVGLMEVAFFVFLTWVFIVLFKAQKARNEVNFINLILTEGKEDGGKLITMGSWAISTWGLIHFIVSKDPNAMTAFSAYLGFWVLKSGSDRWGDLWAQRGMPPAAPPVTQVNVNPPAPVVVPVPPPPEGVVS